MTSRVDTIYTEKERNLTIDYLQAILILMVIDDHVGSRMGFLSSLFPYDSFFMPAFVMISGYFYKKVTIKETISKKLYRLFIPYTIWSIIGNMVSFVLYRLNVVDWYRIPSGKNILLQCFYEPLSEITGPGWFAIMLFSVVIVYSAIENGTRLFTRLFIGGGRNEILSDYVDLAILVSIGLAVTWVCAHHLNEGRVAATILRTGFYLQFYHIGFMFNHYWESRLKKIHPFIVCGICVFTNVVLICLYGNNIRFIGTVAMESFQTWHLPILTSLTGILFWYEFAGMLSIYVGKRREISFLARNTFTIMMVHLAFTKIPQFVAYYIQQHGNSRFSDFNLEAFRTTPFYSSGQGLQLVGFFLRSCR